MTVPAGQGIDVAPAIDWLLGDSLRRMRARDVVAGLCERLISGGVALDRVGIFINTLHPNVLGRRFLWRRGGEVSVSQPTAEFRSTSVYIDSPVRQVMADGRAVRRRLCDPGCPRDFPLLDELRGEGFTDYLASPLLYLDGAVGVVTWTTRRPGGFSDEEIAGLAAAARPLARVAEVYALHWTAANLLDTYLGHGAGERVLAGRIARGDIETIHAVIWFSDLRDFAALADRVPGPAVIDLLNAYFDCQVPAIEADGGEVLKFMGDGLLAIFPVAGEADLAERVVSALRAARAAAAGVAALNDTRTGSGEAPLRFGLALHVGDVLFGNIGGASRLDFTAIGPAVNLAARLEKVARDRGQALVMSSAFARACAEPVRAIGRFDLRGIREPEEVFAPAS